MSNVVYRCTCLKAIAIQDSEGNIKLKNKVIKLNAEMTKGFLVCKGCNAEHEMSKILKHSKKFNVVKLSKKSNV